MRDIYLKLNSQQIAELLKGEEVIVTLVNNQTNAHIIASDDGVQVYRERVNQSLDEVEASLAALYGHTDVK